MRCTGHSKQVASNRQLLRREHVRQHLALEVRVRMPRWRPHAVIGGAGQKALIPIEITGAADAQRLEPFAVERVLEQSEAPLSLMP
jgi:hypothetical protein